MVELLEPFFALIREYSFASLFFTIYFTGDATFIPALFASFHGFLTPWHVLGAAVLASLISDIGWYCFARFLRFRGVAPPKRIRDGKTWQRWHSFAALHTGKALFVTKFISGTRMPLQVFAGYIRYPFLKYALYNFSGTFAFFAIIFVAAYLSREEEISSFYEPELIGRIAIFLVFLFLAQYWLKTNFLKRQKAASQPVEVERE